MKSWVMYCEAAADHRMASRLIDELLALQGSPWVREQLEHDPTTVRRWLADTPGRDWFDVHRVYKQARELGIEVSHGHFNGDPRAAGARMLDTIFRILRAIQKRDPDTTIEAAVVVWDMDKQRRDRAAGLAQADAAERLPSGVTLVLGCPDPIRETWILAGFVPADAFETQRLVDAHRQLGFWPNEQPHELTSGDEGAKRHAKRVLREILGVDTWEREEACLRIPDHHTREQSRVRGEGCGLEAFLNAVEVRLLPLVDLTATAIR